MDELDSALRRVISLFAANVRGSDADRTALLAFRTDQPIEVLLPAIRDLLEPGS